jgi:hypothetical protein
MINQRCLRLLKEFIANPSSETWEPLINLGTPRDLLTSHCLYETFMGCNTITCPPECRIVTGRDTVTRSSDAYLCHRISRRRAWTESPGRTLALAIQFLSFVLSRDDK